MEKENCICSGQFVSERFSNHFNALICLDCGSHKFSRVSGDDSVGFDYSSKTAKYGKKDYLYGSQLRWAHRILLERQWTGRKVVEIGCFNGFFVNSLLKEGADAYGFDINGDALSVGKHIFELEGRLHSNLEDIEAMGPFDDVICVDIIEHLDNPNNFLERLSELLKPGALLYLAGPTIERGFHDKSDFPPHHKWWFSRKGLSICLETNHLSTQDIIVERDGLLLVRNFIGRLIHGFRVKEFYGDDKGGKLALDNKVWGFLYKCVGFIGRRAFTLLGLAYCSSIFVAVKDFPDE